jgi:hypothetical protein
MWSYRTKCSFLLVLAVVLLLPEMRSTSTTPKGTSGSRLTSVTGLSRG